MSTSQKPNIYSVFWITGVCFILIGVVIGQIFPSFAIDIQMHDTYVIIGYGHIVIAFALLFIISWGLYSIILRRGQSQSDLRIIKIHYWVSLLGISILILAKLISSLSKHVDFISLDRGMSGSTVFFVVVTICVILIQASPLIVLIKKLLR